jgi:5-(carboxyamino)imidazole ribonucleotide mutase
MKKGGQAKKTEAKAKRTERVSASSLIPPPSSFPLVAVIMGSTSDWETMRHASEVLASFGVAHESRVVSAHRTPAWMSEFAGAAESRGIEVIIAGAGGAAHLPGMVAAQTLVPVLGVPVKSRALAGLDSLLSIAQMPAGIPVGTLAIGEAGATNAALLAVAILANTRPELRERLRRYRDEQTRRVREATLEAQG